MPTANRNALFARLQKVLRKHYKPWTPPERPVLEQLLFACLLEDAHVAPAEQCMAALEEQFFDWNEVRVSTVPELAEVLTPLPEPAEAATRLRRALQHVFETTYAFELESIRKLKLSQAQQKLEKMHGVTPFAVAFLTQVSLGGHAIPLDKSTLEALAVVGLAEPKEVAAGTITGLERAIPKAKGIEFASLLHQFGAEFMLHKYSPAFHEILIEVNPAAKDRLPKKPTKKQLAEAAAAAEEARRKEDADRQAAAARAAARKAAAARAAAQPQSAKPGKDGKAVKPAVADGKKSAVAEGKKPVPSKPARPGDKSAPAKAPAKPAAPATKARSSAVRPVPAKTPPAGVKKKRPR